MNTMTEVVDEPTVRTTRVAPGKKSKPKKQPGYHVILLDDDDHTYHYVIGMVRRLFGYAEEMAYQLASEVDNKGRVILDTTTFERAELKRDQISAFGRDWRIARCEGSMSAIIEPAPT